MLAVGELATQLFHLAGGKWNTSRPKHRVGEKESSSMDIRIERQPAKTDKDGLTESLLSDKERHEIRETGVSWTVPYSLPKFCFC